MILASIILYTSSDTFAVGLLRTEQKHFGQKMNRIMEFSILDRKTEFTILDRILMESGKMAKISPKKIRFD